MCTALVHFHIYNRAEDIQSTWDASNFVRLVFVGELMSYFPSKSLRLGFDISISDTIDQASNPKNLLNDLTRSCFCVRPLGVATLLLSNLNW